MAFNFSPKTVTDGLVLALDAANPKSYVSGSSVWRDLTANSLSGSLINGPTFNSANGGSIQFDGVDDYSSISNFEQNPSQLSVCVFSKVSTNQIHTFFGHRSESTRLIQLIAQTDSEVRYQLRSSGNSLQTIVKSGLNLYNWHHLCFTFNKTAGNFFLYVNGVEVGSLNYNFGSETFTSTAEYIGCTNNGSFPIVLLNGNVSVFQKYNRALSATEVLQNYNATKGRFGLT